MSNNIAYRVWRPVEYIIILPPDGTSATYADAIILLWSYSSR